MAKRSRSMGTVLTTLRRKGLASRGAPSRLKAIVEARPWMRLLLAYRSVKAGCEGSQPAEETHRLLTIVCISAACDEVLSMVKGEAVGLLVPNDSRRHATQLSS